MYSLCEFSIIDFVSCCVDEEKCSTENICEFANYMEILSSWLAAECEKFAVEMSIHRNWHVKWSKEEEFHTRPGDSHQQLSFSHHISLCILKWQQFPHRNIDFHINMSSHFRWVGKYCQLIEIEMISSNATLGGSENKSLRDEIQFWDGIVIILSLNDLKADIRVKRNH